MKPSKPKSERPPSIQLRKDVWFATARQIIPLSGNFPPGRHVVEVVAAERYAVIDAFVFSSQPLSVVQGVVTTDGYSELLMEVRAELFAGDKLIRSEYVRNPVKRTSLPSKFRARGICRCE